MQASFMEEPPLLLWGLDPVFLSHARLYIKDILELKESNQVSGIFFYKDHPIKQVDILGTVVCVREKEAFYSYGVDDSTGVINCTCWKSSAAKDGPADVHRSTPGANDLDGLVQELRRQESSKAKMEIGDVIRVRGYIKVFRMQREVVASIFYKVDDPTLDMQIMRMLELPYLYKHVYDKPFILPDDMRDQSHEQPNQAVLQRSGLISLLSDKIMMFVKENTIYNFYLPELESVPSLLSAATNPHYNTESDSNVSSSSREIRSLFKEAIHILLKSGIVYQKGQSKDVYYVTDHDKELHKLTLNVIKQDCIRQRHAEKGCHFLHILNCVQQGFGSCINEAILQRVINALEQNSDIVSTMEKYYTTF
ncbi:CST complex subunit STN1 [Rana temporaria]|uniref:CST complex subunit STN1 n=1 Tax=Rana temporaria TaxID=8407 RepID=UPI001AAD4589|nr:CST complex subunit STN1 [Rana temporaria]